MKAARPFPHGMDTHGFGLGALILAFLVPACLWMLAEAARLAGQPQDERRIAFAHAAAGIQGRLPLLRALEKRAAADTASAEKSDFYRQRRDEARRQIGELARSAAASAGDPGQQLRLARLDRLVRVADSRYARVLASAGTEATSVTVVQR